MAKNDKQAANSPEAAPNRPTDEERAAKKAEREAKRAAKKAERAKRVKYPVPEGGLETWPEDYDAKKHKPLSRNAFKDETLWLTKKADFHEAQAKKIREEIEEIKQLGPGKDRAKAKKLMKVQGELDALKAALAATGVNVEELLAKRAS